MKNTQNVSLFFTFDFMEDLTGQKGTLEKKAQIQKLFLKFLYNQTINTT